MKTQTKQSSADRIRRLVKGRCPVHGIPMCQVGQTADQTADVAGCPRRDCDIRATTLGPDEPAVFVTGGCPDA